MKLLKSKGMCININLFDPVWEPVMMSEHLIYDTGEEEFLNLLTSKSLFIDLIKYISWYIYSYKIMITWFKTFEFLKFNIVGII